MEWINWIDAALISIRVPGLNWLFLYRRSDMGSERLASVSVVEGINENSGVVEDVLVTRSSRHDGDETIKYCEVEVEMRELVKRQEIHAPGLMDDEEDMDLQSIRFCKRYF